MNILGIKPTQEEINVIINEYELDGDGHIDCAEFQQSYMSYAMLYAGGVLPPMRNRCCRRSGSSIGMELVCWT